MYRLMAVAFLLLVIPLSALGQGTVVDTSFYSEALGQEKNVSVYLPEGYGNHWWMRYPVIYYLHGAGQLLGHDEFPALVSALDAMIADGSIWPVIVVRPDGFTSPYPAGFYTSSVLYGDIEGCLIDDLIQWTDSNYKTIPWKRKRAVMGHSMGAYGAIKYYGEHPDIYCAAAGVCISGADLTTMMGINIYGVLAELQGPPYYYYPSAGFANGVLFSMSGAFSPNMANPPYYVDLPIDEYASMIPEIWALWLEHDLIQYLDWMGSDCWWDQTTLYFDAGTEDQFYIVPACNAFAANLDAMGADYEYQVFEGGHFDKLDERFPIALEFLCTAMHHRWGWWWDSQEEYCAVEADLLEPQNTMAIADHYCSDRTVTFELLEPADVTVTIYDAMGRTVASPFSGYLDPGRQTVSFGGNSFASGMYFYSVTANNETVTGKLLLIP